MLLIFSAVALHSLPLHDITVSSPAASYRFSYHRWQIQKGLESTTASVNLQKYFTYFNHRKNKLSKIRHNFQKLLAG